MQRLLSFEQTPPLSAPLRFFLSAPLFALAAALLLAWYGQAALVSRWTPITLALTHLLTLGFVSMSMIGALLQILPVVAAADIAWPTLTARLVHALLGLGTIALAAGFLLGAPYLFRLALCVLLAAFGWFVAVCLHGLRGTAGGSPMLAAIRLALIALSVVAGLGAAGASAFGWGLVLPLAQITDLHAAWGLIGWVGLLIAGVAYQVVPMFQVTPLYPSAITRWLAPALFIALLFWTISRMVAVPTPFSDATWSLAIGGGGVAFGVITLDLLRRRKRPKPDATTLFWRTALISLVACAALWAAMPTAPAITVGVLFIIGFACSAINGMLYKIVPFLVWYHLQDRLAGARKAPNVKQILPDVACTGQFRAHLLALALLVAATVWPHLLARPAAIAFAASSAWLTLNLLRAARTYRRLTPPPPSHLSSCTTAQNRES